MQDDVIKINSEDEQPPPEPTAPQENTTGAGTTTGTVPDTRERRDLHPVVQKLRDLRRASGLSLATIERDHNIRSVVVGAYERGDREPPLKKIDAMLSIYGYRLSIEPIEGIPVVRSHAEMAEQLRRFADQLATE